MKLLAAQPPRARRHTRTAHTTDASDVVLAAANFHIFMLHRCGSVGNSYASSGALDVSAALLARISETWRQLGEKRPYWSVLAGPEFQGEDTVERQQAFYDSGVDDLRILLATLSRVGRRPEEFTVVFEFGCGLGRVTSHLCKQFSHVIATDISYSHLALARRALNERGATNVDLKCASATDFGMSESYDLWFNRLVLQHNPPPLIAAILARAMTLLRPRGLAVFQVPVYLPGYRSGRRVSATTGR